MILSLRHLLGWIVSSFHSREDLVLENLALRRQLLALHAQRPRTRLREMGSEPTWQKTVLLERWVGSCRRDLLDHEEKICMERANRAEPARFLDFVSVLLRESLR